MTERKVEILLDAIEKTGDHLVSSDDHSVRPIRKFNALDLIGKANTAVISLGSQEYILRLTKQNKLILTK